MKFTEHIYIPTFILETPGVLLLEAKMLTFYKIFPIGELLFVWTDFTYSLLMLDLSSDESCILFAEGTRVPGELAYKNMTSLQHYILETHTVFLSVTHFYKYKSKNLHTKLKNYFTEKSRISSSTAAILWQKLDNFYFKFNNQ